MELSVVIPCYNEEQIIERTVLNVHDQVAAMSKSFEILISDDGSRDATPKICEKLAKKYSSIKHVYYPTGPSRRENVAATMRASKGSIVAFLDADLAVSPHYLPKLVSSIKSGNDVATGSRYLSGSLFKRNLARMVISRVYNVFMRVYFGSRVKDHQCGFKAFSREALLPLLDEMGYDSSYRRGWFWDAEILIRAQKKKLRVHEFPIRWQEGAKSTFNVKREVRMIPYVLGLRFRL